MNQSGSLKNLLLSGKTLVMPDAYDPISARLIEKSGFKAIQCSGYSFSIALARQKEIDISRSENVEITRRIVNAVEIPVMADAEDGYGCGDDLKKTVNMFMEAGVAGLNLEDQILDNANGVCIIDEGDMVEKINITRETAEKNGNMDFIINGRTDALKSLSDREKGLNLAVERANVYLDAGADITFIPYVETLEEAKTLVNQIKGPMSIAIGMPYNIKNLSIKNLKDLGIARVSLPTLLIYSSLKGVYESLNHLKNEDILGIDENMLYDVDELKELLKI
jgi:2-methylisocitrate lyase-like PEP mutase family enzyme